MLCNVVDVPPLCSFILPAIVHGATRSLSRPPASARRLAKRMEGEIGDLFGEAYAELAELLDEAPRWAKATLPTYDERKAFFEGIIQRRPDPVELLRAGDRRAVLDLIASRQAALTGV